jgi:hypothetical protein
MHPADQERCRGAVLLEVIVALAILTTVGITALAMSAEAARTVQRARDTERRLRAASAFLEGVVLWPRSELDLRLGERPQGPWRLRIDRPFPDLYVVTVSDTAGGHELLRTSLFRPEPSRAIE